MQYPINILLNEKKIKIQKYLGGLYQNTSQNNQTSTHDLSH